MFHVEQSQTRRRARRAWIESARNTATVGRTAAIESRRRRRCPPTDRRSGGSLMTMRPPGRTQPSGVRSVWHRRAETAGDDGIERPAGRSTVVRILGQDVDPVRPSQAAHHPGQEIGPRSAAVEQGHVPRRLVVGDHEPGHAAAGTEIERPSSRSTSEFLERASTNERAWSITSRSDGAPRNPSCCDRREYVDEQLVR